MGIGCGEDGFRGRLRPLPSLWFACGWIEDKGSVESRGEVAGIEVEHVGDGSGQPSKDWLPICPSCQLSSMKRRIGSDRLTV